MPTRPGLLDCIERYFAAAPLPDGVGPIVAPDPQATRPGEAGRPGGTMGA